MIFLFVCLERSPSIRDGPATGMKLRDKMTKGMNAHPKIGSALKYLEKRRLPFSR